MVMQSAFFKLAEVLPIDDAIKYLKEAIVKDYGAKGDNIVQMNYQAVEAGVNALHKVKVNQNWAGLEEESYPRIEGASNFVNDVLIPMNRQEGNKLPVSTFADNADGTFPSET